MDVVEEEDHGHVDENVIIGALEEIEFSWNALAPQIRRRKFPVGTNDIWPYYGLAIEQVSEHLGVSPRTLPRRMAEDGYPAWPSPTNIINVCVAGQFFIGGVFSRKKVFPVGRHLMTAYRDAVWFHLFSAVMLVCVYVVPMCFACAAFVPATHIRIGYIIISIPLIAISLLFLTEYLIVSYQKWKAKMEAKKLAKAEEERRAKAEKEVLERQEEVNRVSAEMASTLNNALMV